MLTLLRDDKIDVMPTTELRKLERERSTGKKTMGEQDKILHINSGQISGRSKD